MRFSLLHKVWLAHLADVDARIPLLLATMVPLGLELDLAAHQGVVCVAVRAVVGACEENVLNGGSSDQDEIQLVPVFGAWVSPGDLVLGLGLEEGVGNTQVVVCA